VTRVTSLSLAFGNWQHSASPVIPDILGLPEDMNEIDQGKIAQNYRGRMWWWQYSYPRIPRIDPYPGDRSFQSGFNNTINGLYIHFDPK
jgi:hypothetical protein